MQYQTIQSIRDDIGNRMPQCPRKRCVHIPKPLFLALRFVFSLTKTCVTVVRDVIPIIH